MAGIVLDASAVLTVVHGEPGAELVAGCLRNGVISAVNLAEVISKLIERGQPSERALEIVAPFPFKVVPVDEGLAHDIGVLRARTAHLGLSLGDRACLALGRRLGLPVLTCDRPWASLDLGMEIRLVR